MQKPTVTVVIPNYNYARYLREAVDSVLAQTYPHVEAIVVDDGSSDNSRELIESYNEKVKAIFQENQGVAAARNRGVVVGRGEYIAFLDADDRWLPTKVERQVIALESNPNAGLVHVGVREINDNGAAIRTRLDGMDGHVASELLLFERPVVLGGGSGLMLTRTLFEAVGGFDTRMSTSADWDLFYRVANRRELEFVPEVLLDYRVHRSNMHGNIRAMEHDTMLGFQKAFANGASADQRICYGNLHRTLAGSYFRAGQYADFAKHALKSIWNRPSNVRYFARFPLRRMQSK